MFSLVSRVVMFGARSYQKDFMELFQAQLAWVS